MDVIPTPKKKPVIDFLLATIVVMFFALIVWAAIILS